MANQKHLDELKKGSESWNRWRAKHRKTVPNLRFANLFRLNLPDGDLSGADLYGANLSQINLNSADLHGANLIGANLTDANLRSANLSRANLSGASLSGADFSNIRFGWTIFSDVDLSHVKYLCTAMHYGPSSIDIESLRRSGGDISEDFLKGCGLLDDFIDCIQTFIKAQSAIQFYSCFISYNKKDERCAKRLYYRLRSAGIRVWYAPEDMSPGRKLEEQIEDAIRVHDKLLLVLSQHSLNSDWVKTEICKARQAELKTGQRKLFPIRLVDQEKVEEWKCFDADSGQDLAKAVREYFIPDFSSWEDEDSFEQVFARLLTALSQKQAVTPANSTED